MEQHVRAAIDQAGGGFGFFGRVEPFIDPDHFGLDLGVAALGAQGEAVDVTDHFRNWHRSDNAQRAGLAHFSCDHAGHVSAFVGAAIVGAHVVGGFVAGGMLKLYVFEFGGQLEHGFHVAESGAENHFIALAGHVADDALGVSGFGHVFYKGGKDLVAEFFFNRFAGVVMCKRPAAIAHRADIGKGDLQRLGFGCRWGGCRSLRFFAAAHQHRCGNSCHRRNFQQRTFLHICHVISFLESKVREGKKIFRNRGKTVFRSKRAY